MRLREMLRETLPGECLDSISNSFHVVGEIAVLCLPPELDGCKRAVALAVLSQSRNIRMVLNKTSKLEGDRRVAAQVRPGERMLVPFAGVGPFAIPIAARKAEVIALEKSREACRWLAENVRRNGVEERTAVLNADAEHMAQMLKLEFDRAVIPAPYGMDWRFSSTAGAET